MNAAEIGRTASKLQSSSCAKLTGSQRGSGSTTATTRSSTESSQDGAALREQLIDSNSPNPSPDLRTAAANTPRKDVTSTARAVQEAPIADKTTINIGQTMNQLNEQENLKQLNLAPVQGNQVEEMDTQEGMRLFKDS